MTFPLLAALVLLTPVSGVVSGGRMLSFNMKSGLIPAIQWLSVPGIPAAAPGDFTEITFQTGCENSFSVVSSGKTAGINPLIASRVTENGYAAQFLLGDLSIYGVVDDISGSCTASYENITIDLCGSSLEDVHPAGEYSDDYILFAATENSSALGVSLPLGESLSIGPAYVRDEVGGDFWLLSTVELGPFTFVSAPAIDGQNSYQRLYGTFECSGSEVLYGWNGTDWYDQYSFRGNEFLAAVSITVPGVMAGYSPDDNLLLLVSHREEGWFQGEIQGKFLGVTAGANLLRAPDNHVHWGFSAGVSVGSNTANGFWGSLATPWYSRIAASSCVN
ncbi:MAG: hypothetical protein KAS73_01575 [Candidatus Sabulitectum sp.]|nr:hypothetical protein [Candidatus Sabulitectum sp.]